MTIIRIAEKEIPYLKEEILEKYKNAIVVSAEGMMIKMNSLMLCAISQSIKMALSEDYDDYTIITEFSLDELKQLKAYYTGGVCEKISESMIKSFGLKEIENRNNALNQNQSNVDDDFIDNKNMKSQDCLLETLETKSMVLEPLENSLIISTTEDIIPTENMSVTADEDTKNESVDENTYNMEDELIEDEDDKEFDFGLEYCSDNSSYNPTEVEKTEAKNKVKRKKKLREDDIDWEQTSDNADNQPSKREYLEFRKELSQENLELLKNFELPKSLESYKRKPKNLQHIKHKIEQNKNDKTKPFQCSQCPQRASQEIALKRHIIRHHFEHFYCPYCDGYNSAYHLEDVEDFKKHVFIHLNLSKNADKFKGCIQCGKTGRVDLLEEHYKQRGPLHNDECSQCSKKMASFQEYQNHVYDQHYDVWKYKCGYCSMIFDDRKECLQHTRKVHRQHEFKLKPKKEKPVKSKPENMKGVCHLCGANSNNIKVHMKYNHHGQSTYPCSQCDKICQTKAKLRVHMGNVHLKTPCPHCGLLIKHKKLYHHIYQKHTADHEKPYPCQDCGKGFLTKTTYDEHMNVHNGEKPFKCIYCPNTFASRGTKEMHQKGHLGIKRKPKKV